MQRKHDERLLCVEWQSLLPDLAKVVEMQTSMI